MLKMDIRLFTLPVEINWKVLISVDRAAGYSFLYYKRNICYK
jgi:hypothetical protein